MIKFGPAGNDNKFIEEGYKKLLDAPQWIKRQGLDLYEISFGHGIVINSIYANNMRQEIDKSGIEVSIHAPYYINFANPSEEMEEKSINHVINSLKILKILGGKILVIHSGTQLKLDRQTAMDNIISRYKKLIKIIYEEGLEDMYICPETMGKHSQIGSVDEIIEICKLDKILLPTFDFGHINSVTNGSLKTKEDYNKIIKKCYAELGEEKTKNMHIHFSKIEYGIKGEIRHLTFEDNIYGPDYKNMIDALIENNIDATIICESNGTMATDAKIMKDYYLDRINNYFVLSKDLKKGDYIYLENNIYLCNSIQRITDKENTTKIILLDLLGEQKEIILKENHKVKKVFAKKIDVIYKGRQDLLSAFELDGERYTINKKLIERDLCYIKIDDKCKGLFYDNSLIGVECSDVVSLKVEKVERKNKSWELFNLKNVQLETGIWISVPLNIEKGDEITIDTKLNKYVEKSF